MSHLSEITGMLHISKLGGFRDGIRGSPQIVLQNV